MNKRNKKVSQRGGGQDLGEFRYKHGILDCYIGQMFKKKRRKSNFLTNNKKQSYSNGRLRATLVPSAALRERLSERRGEGAAKSWKTKSFFGGEQAVWELPKFCKFCLKTSRGWAEGEALTEARDHLQVFSPSASYSARAPSLLTNVRFSLIAVHMSSLSKGSL